MEIQPSSNDTNPETQPSESESPALLTPSPSPNIASISLSLSSILPLPTHFFTPSKTTHLFSPKSHLKIPPQITSSLSNLSLSQKPISKNSSFSPTPLQNPLFLTPKLPSDPSNGAALRKSTIVWFRNDLRVHDNECLTTANNESLSVLPLYCFDPRDYGKSSSGFDKTGPFRAHFLIQSVTDLRDSLKSRGSDLVVRVGNPETVLVELVKAIGADALYLHREVSNAEAKSEAKIEAAMKEEGVEVKYFWGSTLYHVEDLPFKLEDMPSNYGGFRENVQGLKVRETIAALDQFKGLPSRGDVEPGDIPSLVDLGLNPNATLSQDLKGGESEALQRLQKFGAECKAQPPKSEDGTNNIYGANFSCKISPWLAMGCLSPRHMFDELKKTASRTISAKNQKDGDDGMNWLMFELLWRDFFRFITAKYSSAKKQVDTTPATACTGALA